MSVESNIPSLSLHSDWSRVIDEEQSGSTTTGLLSVELIYSYTTLSLLWKYVIQSIVRNCVHQNVMSN